MKPNIKLVITRVSSSKEYCSYPTNTHEQFYQYGEGVGVHVHTCFVISEKKNQLAGSLFFLHCLSFSFTYEKLEPTSFSVSISFITAYLEQF